MMLHLATLVFLIPGCADTAATTRSMDAETVEKGRPALRSLVVTPESATLDASTTLQFNAAGTWSDGSTTPPTVVWSASGGAISSTGLFTAPTGSGAVQIVARHAGGTMADTSTVTVLEPVPPPASAAECASIRQEWIWCDDFEQDRLASYFERSAAYARTSGVGHEGSWGMRARFGAGTINAGSLKVAFGRTPQPYFRPVDAGTANYRELYWRVYLKYAPGWVGGGADKLSRMTIFASASSWAQAMIAHVWSAGTSGHYLFLDPASGTDAQGNLKTTAYNDFPHLRWLGAVGSATPIFDASHVGTWYCIETRVRLNDAGLANGVFALWINGALEAQRNGLNWVGSYSAYGLNALFLENFWNTGSPVAQERFMDRLVVSTQPIGC